MEMRSQRLVLIRLVLRIVRRVVGRFRGMTGQSLRFVRRGVGRIEGSKFYENSPFFTKFLKQK